MFHFRIPKITLFCSIIFLLIGHSASVALLHSKGKTQQSFIQPFSLADVDLDEASDFFQGQALNHDYLLILDVDNLLYNFRTTAGLPNPPGQSYGGWEGSNVEVRGQFIGHYLSALAFAAKSTNNEKFQQRADALISGLAECQAAHGDGYLSAFPKEHFDRLKALQPVWAPLYVIHKIMQGLLDQHQLTAQPQALETLSSMAKYFCTWSERVIADHGIEHWHQVLENEFGGMNDVLYKLAIEEERKLEKNKKNKSSSFSLEEISSDWATCASLFDKPAWFDPLVQGQDVLSGLHANTHLAQVNGFASRFEATGDETAAAAVVNFFNIVTERHSYSTGGSNWFEHWGEGQALGDAIDNADAAANTQESCTTYNILKIARSLLTWTARADFADFYERAILNGVLGIQRVATGTNPHHNHHHHEEKTLLHHHDHSTHSMHSPNLHLPSSLLTERERAMIAATDGVHAMHSRPADHSVVSWPDDPATNITATALLSQTGNINIQNNINDEPGQPGQFIYYMPLGHEGGKGENPRAWTHGWGDRFNTFWCCYGTAVESFSKLADSIYFWYTHPSSTFDSNSNTNNTIGDGEQGDSAYPILFVNQFVSSTLRWNMPLPPSMTKISNGDGLNAAATTAEEEGGVAQVVIKQTADFYSSNVATSRVVITIPSPFESKTSTVSTTTESGTDGTIGVSNSTNGSDSVKFYLYWRLPSWLKHEEESRRGEQEVEDGSGGGEKNDHVGNEKRLAIRINGKSLDVNTLPRLHGAVHQGNKDENTKLSSTKYPESVPLRVLPHLQLPLSSFNPPIFGKDAADYIILGPEWQDGDVIEVYMPMKITTEDLNDSRPEKQNLKAIMMGPFQMAGLIEENGDREIDVDPEDIENAVTMLETITSEGSYSYRDEDININNNGGVRYPKGARLLSGKTKKYVIAPIGQLIDEKYSAYFDFVSVGPSEAVASQ